MRTFWAIPLLLLCAPPMFSDGGAIQMRQETSVFIITVFAAPVPLRPGPADISVLVQDRTSQNPVLDAKVFIQTVQATHAQAQNKLLYAASLNLDSPGEWKYSV